MKLQLEEHLEYVFMYLTNFKNKYDMILELQWLKKHNSQIDWINETLRFHTTHYLQSCFWHHLFYVHVHDYSNMSEYELSASWFLNSTHDTKKNKINKSENHEIVESNMNTNHEN